jgi:hypothetical protein
MKNLKNLFTLLSMALAIACFHVSAAGQSAEDKNKIASIAPGGDSVRWK